MMQSVYLELIAVLIFVGIARQSWCQEVCPCNKFDLIEAECKNTDKFLACSPNEEIIGGEPADILEWPYIVSLQLQVPSKGENCYSHFCGGALIASNVLVTAAHCFEGGLALANNTKGLPFEEIFVSQAPPCRHLYNSRGVIGYRSKAVQVEKYPDFLLKTIAGDLAIVVLDTNLPGPYVQLEKEFSNRRTSATITIAGYGAINPNEHKYKNLYNMRQLYKANLRYQGSALCGYLLTSYDVSVNNTQANSAQYFNSTSMICAYNQAMDSCKGDSGGPAVIKGNIPEQDILVGVMSWGPMRQCTSSQRGQSPAIFTRISAHYDWIVAKLADYPPGYAVDTVAGIVPGFSVFDGTDDVVLTQSTP